MAAPIQHHLASGIHPAAFVQSTPPLTTDVQDHVLWVDTSTGPPYQLWMWNQGAATWVAVSSVVGSSDIHTPCLLFLSHRATICNDSNGVIHFNTPDSAHALDASGYELPGGGRLEYGCGV